MQTKYFVKQNHKNVKIPFILLFLCILIITIAFNIRIKQLYFESLIFLSIVLLLFIGLIVLFNSFGVYVLNEKIYYKKITNKLIDVKSIVGIKIIKAEAQINLAWSSLDLKDKQNNVLYTSVYLSNVEKDMKDYPYGDIEFISYFKKDVIMHSVYDERFIEYLKQLNNQIKVLY